MVKRIMSSALAACVALTLLAGAIPLAVAAPIANAAPGAIAAAAATPVIEYFKEPDRNSKPMARMWFPDCSAAADPNDTVEKQIFELAEKGFGGVEFTVLSDTGRYDNAQAKLFGWGTENFNKLLKKVFAAANKVPGGFQVDVTITAHWPPTLNVLDPNDNAASMETSYAITKVTSSALGDGAIELNLPPQKTGGSFARTYSYNFLFTDTFESAALARVSRMNGANPVIDFSTIRPISSRVAAYGGEPAGVPDRATAEARGWDYDNILEIFGPEPAGAAEYKNGLLVGAADGKQDAERNRKRMADWQDYYTVDLSGLELAGLNDDGAVAAGDWVIIGVFYRGTGQVFSGGDGKCMHNLPFTTNYFTDAGTKIITDYWDNYVLDQELTEMMLANGGSIFEDSIEASKTGQAAYWASDYMANFPADYVYRDVLPIVMSSTNIGFENDGGITARIREDFNDMAAELYRTTRVKAVSDWALSTIGYTFRAQTRSLPGLDIGSASLIVDVPEGDNGAKGDGLRNLAAPVNLAGKDYLTMEAITGRAVNQITLADVKTELGQNYSGGVSRAILHGTAYSKSINGYGADWPGWLPFGTSFGSAYTYRQAYWDDFATEVGYMARTQAVIQKGTAKIDVAVLINKAASFSLQSGNYFQPMLDAGYSYNRMSEAILFADGVNVTNKLLAEHGPAYRALVIDRVSILSWEAMQIVMAYADAGLPIVIHNSNIAAVYGTKREDDAKVASAFAALKQKPNAIEADTAAGVLDALRALGVSPRSRYSIPRLESTMYADPLDGTNYYYLFNNTRPNNSGMLAGGQGASYKIADQAIAHAPLTLEGDGVPYMLDAVTGDIIEVGEYAANGDGTVTVMLNELRGGDSAIIAVTPSAEGFPAAGQSVKSVNRPRGSYSVARVGGMLALRSNAPGTYTATLANGRAKTVSVAKALDPLDLSGEKWNLAIESYAPRHPNARAMVDANGIQTVDPSESVVTAVDFGLQNLGNWSDIPATAAQLEALGVASMRNVSGVGYYTIKFEAPADWDESTGAYLDVAYARDQIGSFTVNGHLIPNANNASDRVDLAGLLVPGENEITIKLSTTLYARAWAEHHLYTAAFDAAYANGLQSVRLLPYTQLGLESAFGVSAVEDSVHYGRGKVEYMFTADKMESVNLFELTFEVDGGVLSGAEAVLGGLNGFTVFDGPNWTHLGGGLWQGRAIIGIIESGQTKSGAMDVARLAMDAVKLGDAKLKLTDVRAFGIDMVDGKAVSSERPCAIAPASATARVYSVYDIDGDGAVGLADLSLAFYHYMSRIGDANWDDAKVADVNGDGVVNMLDLVEIYANFVA